MSLSLYHIDQALEALIDPETGELLEQRSKIISERVAAGKLAIVGVTYKLNDGRAYLRSVIGDVEDVPHGPGEEMVAV